MSFVASVLDEIKTYTHPDSDGWTMPHPETYSLTAPEKMILRDCNSSYVFGIAPSDQVLAQRIEFSPKIRKFPTYLAWRIQPT